jgi:hypothetical protein
VDTFEIAKRVLREHILANTDKVRQDLDDMRKISAGSDIYKYVDNLADSLAIQNVLVLKENS